MSQNESIEWSMRKGTKWIPKCIRCHRGRSRTPRRNVATREQEGHENKKQKMEDTKVKERERPKEARKHRRETKTTMIVDGIGLSTTYVKLKNYSSP